MIIVTIDNASETFNRVLKTDQLARRAGKYLGNVERLRQETLDLARTRHGQLVFY